ncbi:MAG TPA: hypothetical protein VGI10_04920 [Polyangiaceae bacterium]|jgi:hypothetical protein
MSDALIKKIDKAVAKRPARPAKKKRSSSKPRSKPRKPRIVFRTRTKTVVKVRRVFVKGSSSSTRRKTSKKRPAKKGGRKPKFGSPAWRKKYMKRGKR